MIRLVIMVWLTGLLTIFAAPRIGNSQCESLSFVGIPAVCEKHNIARCSVTSTTAAVTVSNIIPFDGSVPGAIVVGPAMEWYRTEDEYGEPAGGYCVPTSTAEIGVQYFKAGYFRGTDNGENLVTWVHPTYTLPTTAGPYTVSVLPKTEVVACGADYQVDTSQVAIVNPDNYCIKAVLSTYRSGVPSQTLFTETSCGIFPPATLTEPLGTRVDIHIPMHVMGEVAGGDEGFYRVFTSGAAPAGAAYKVLDKECRTYPHS